jgi:acetyl esterase/lipase
VPTAALLHGGFWRAAYGPDLMTGLARDLEGRGWSVANVSYLRVGEPGGGWPGTLDSVRAAVAAARPDVVIGHSAGGHLALWSAFHVGCALAVSMAGVVDLDAAAALSSGAVVDLLGGRPDEVPERYAAASPRALLPLGVRTLLVHGALDDTVPVSMSEAYAAAAREAGDDVELAVIPGEGHFDCLEVASASWQAVVDRLP